MIWEDETFNKLISRDDVKDAVAQSGQLQSMMNLALGMSPLFLDPDCSHEEREQMTQQARRTFVSELRVMGIEPMQWD